MPRGRDAARTGLAVLAALAGFSLAEPAGWALAAFTGTAAVPSATYSTATVTPPTNVRVSQCSYTVLGLTGNRVTLSWTAASAGTSSYAIRSGGSTVDTVPATQTTWTSSTPLTSGSVSYQVRAVYGSAGVWYADSGTITATYSILSPGC